MRLLQNIFAYPAYLRHLDRLCDDGFSYKSRIETLIEDGYSGVHLLEPVVRREQGAMLCCSSDGTSQRAWAREMGMPTHSTYDSILLAQLEHHKAEVFYTQDPARYSPSFLKSLPSSVRVRVCWQSPPAIPGDLRGYDLVMNNFPTSLSGYAKQGVKTAYFTPSFDPRMGDYCDNADRPIDVAFVGGYSRHHLRRADVLEAVAKLGGRYRVMYALDPGRVARFSEAPLLSWLPFGRYRRPKAVRAVSIAPVFGRAMYELFSKSKIVLNGAVDSAGEDRGNMRCFEGMGCGALMVTDAGQYPTGMEDGVSMCVYDNAANAAKKIERLIEDDELRQRIGKNGLQTMREVYSKSGQWRRFVELMAAL